MQLMQSPHVLHPRRLPYLTVPEKYLLMFLYLILAAGNGDGNLF